MNRSLRWKMAVPVETATTEAPALTASVWIVAAAWAAVPAFSVSALAKAAAHVPSIMQMATAMTVIRKLFFFMCVTFLLGFVGPILPSEP